ncbi:hypothetical protein PR202_ga10943 [Eleusine coracana subsp. coracana]|uniref:DUF6598 domain-containing protein n=1 Tax=Eleusine coracana subsp. coracana TaxID=191504 RepID=A0AAV5C876_ELECO|nr:hypothetical protein PR202_ga10943 [Eleusine coracana subsp. coracana]
MEAREKEKILSSIRKKLQELGMSTKQEKLSGMSDADREAKMAQVKEERAVLMREFLRVSSEIRDPDYSDMSEEERAEEAERLRQEAIEEALRLEMAGDLQGSLEKQCVARIVDFDPKQQGMYFNCFFFFDPATFDHDQESPFGPMRFTYKVYGNVKPEVCEAVNILSVKIACSDVGFPIQVYGSALPETASTTSAYISSAVTETIANASNPSYPCCMAEILSQPYTCGKHIQLTCHVIFLQDEPLILTGPKRGLALLDNNYVETDLKIKDHQGQDRELSKGIIIIRGIAGRSLKKCEVETNSLATRLSTVDVMYAVVIRAVEGTIGIRVLQGEFAGTITAHTTSIQKKIVLYDSKVAGAKTRDGNVQLMRPVVCVYVRDMLIIDTETSAGEYSRLEFTPKGNSGERVVITLGGTKLRVKVAWSIMDP